MIEDRAYATGTGPVVCVDEGHGNAYTLDDGLWPFADLLRRDGYVMRAVTTVDRAVLADCRILVIASPRRPLAQAEETRRWVGEGGGLLLLADRESSTVASGLAARFGTTFTDTRVMPVTFRSTDKTLRPHAIARGRHAKESAAIVATFGSQSMHVAESAEPVLVAADGAVHGAVIVVEMGRAAFFGDVMLFTSQIAGPERRLIGMNAPGAERNFHFVLNVMHWLSRVI
jgi:hypothetical protein